MVLIASCMDGLGFAIVFWVIFVQESTDGNALTGGASESGVVLLGVFFLGGEFFRRQLFPFFHTLCVWKEERKRILGSVQIGSAPALLGSGIGGRGDGVLGW
jgi:hypothetical protein